MNESRLRARNWETAEIAYTEPGPPEYPDASAVALAEERNQPGTGVVPANVDRAANESGELSSPLLADAELGSFRARWDQVQASFVDEPREAVRSADSLVASVVQRIEEQVAQERNRLEKQWESGTNASTEEMRQALKRYRALFGRLLAF